MENPQTCPRHCPGLERQASARKRLYLELEVGPQVCSQENHRMRCETQQSRKQSQESKPDQPPRIVTTVKCKYGIESQESKVGQTQGNVQSYCTRGLVLPLLRVAGVSPIHKNSNGLSHPPRYIPTAIQLISIYPSG